MGRRSLRSSVSRQKLVEIGYSFAGTRPSSYRLVHLILGILQYGGTFIVRGSRGHVWATIISVMLA